MKTQIMLLTQNKQKISAAQVAFADTDIEIIPANREYLEVQADTSIEIAKFSALEGAKETGIITIREDHSLFINALGFPGPYMQFIERVIAVEKLIEILKLSNDKTGYFELGAVVAYPDGRTEEYSYKVPVHFKEEITVPDPRNGWNGIICLEGETRAFTEYPSSERDAVWSSNFKNIANSFK
jgi:inosine/xanthosine triphosphate pyrophosphatase family protein